LTWKEKKAGVEKKNFRLGMTTTKRRIVSWYFDDGKIERWKKIKKRSSRGVTVNSGKDMKFFPTLGVLRGGRGNGGGGNTETAESQRFKKKTNPRNFD